MKRNIGKGLLFYAVLILLVGEATIANAQRNRRTPPRRQARPAPAPQQRNTNPGGDSSLTTTTLEITQVYRPEVKLAPRPDFSPAPPASDTTRVAQQYDVPQQTLNYTYRSLPLRPLALGADTAKQPYQSYLRLGGGNLSTVFADAGIAALKGENYESAIHARHISQTGDITGQQSSLTELQANGTMRSNTHIWDAALSGMHNRYRYYGYDHDTYLYTIDSLKQSFTGVRLAVGAQNEQALEGGWRYHPVVHVSYYRDKMEASERGFGFSLPVSKDFDSMLQLRVALSGSFYQYKVGDTLNRGNGLFQIEPAVRYHRGGFEGLLGLTPSFGYKTWLLPQISAGYHFSDLPLEVKAGWCASVQQNTYEALSIRNPYMTNLYGQKQTRSDEVYGSAQLAFAKYFSVNARVSYWQWTDLPLFLNNYGGEPDGKRFMVVYDGLVNAISLQAGMRYQVAESFSIGASGSWYNFYHSTWSRVWHEPAVRLKADIALKPIKNLQVTGYASVLDQIYAQEATGREVKLPAFVDLGAGAQYQMIPRLGLFMQLSNILNRRNERWRNYPSYGFNIYGGVSFRF